MAYFGDDVISTTSGFFKKNEGRGAGLGGGAAGGGGGGLEGGREE